MHKQAKTIILSFLIIFFCCINVFGAKPDNQTAAEISQLFNSWNASLQTGNPDEVVKNYANDSILLPTLSNKIRHNPVEIKDYFKHFLESKPKGEINEQNIRVFGNDIAINSGKYTFYLLKDGKPSAVKARYTFVYHKVGNKWLIVEHHSSMMPEGR